MRVALFVTCLVDQCRPEVGVATVRLLRRLGCRVDFDSRQTCCGQPAWNAGYAREAAEVATRNLDFFLDADAVVLPSGSCAAMFRHFPGLFAAAAERSRAAAALAAKTFELSEFLVRRLGVEDVGAAYPGRLTWHDACHGLRELGLRTEARRLLAKVRGATFVDMAEADACCGFGGTFAAKSAELSLAILDRKIDAIAAAEVDTVVSGDLSCLLQIGGRLERRGVAARPLHLAEVLAGVPV